MYLHQYLLRAVDSTRDRRAYHSAFNQLAEEERGGWAFRLRHSKKNLGGFINVVVGETKALWKQLRSTKRSPARGQTLRVIKAALLV